MFDAYPMNGSILKSRVNSVIGIAFVGSCALWAALFITQATWGTNPIANAFSAAIERETVLK